VLNDAPSHTRRIAVAAAAAPPASILTATAAVALAALAAAAAPAALGPATEQGIVHAHTQLLSLRCAVCARNSKFNNCHVKYTSTKGRLSN